MEQESVFQDYSALELTRDFLVILFHPFIGSLRNNYYPTLSRLSDYADSKIPDHIRHPK